MVLDSGKKKCLCNNFFSVFLYACSKMTFFFHLQLLVFVCVQYATGMAAASQTIIVRTALSYQDVYEVWYHSFFAIFNVMYLKAALTTVCSIRFLTPQKRVVREESKLLSMMPLTATSKANRTLLYSIQREVSSCF